MQICPHGRLLRLSHFQRIPSTYRPKSTWLLEYFTIQYDEQESKARAGYCACRTSRTIPLPVSVHARLLTKETSRGPIFLSPSSLDNDDDDDDDDDFELMMHIDGIDLSGLSSCCHKASGCFPLADTYP